MHLDANTKRMAVSLARLPSGSKIVEPQEIQSALLRMNELAVLYQEITKTADDKAAYELESNELDAGIFDMAGKTFAESIFSSQMARFSRVMTPIAHWTRATLQMALAAALLEITRLRLSSRQMQKGSSLNPSTRRLSKEQPAELKP